MARASTWILRIFGGLLFLLVVAVAAIYLISSARLGKRYAIAVEPVAIPTDSASIAWGEHIADIRGCRGCHTPTLAGESFIDAPIIARLWARNLTRGRGGIGATFTDADWVRAIRHGVRPDSLPLLFMPAQDFYSLNDHDLGALIAWLKTVPPVDSSWPPNKVGLMGRILYLAGALPLVPAERINHTAPRPADVPPGETVAYGKYLATACSGCHGDGFSGGQIPGAPPGMLAPRNITPDSLTGIGTWTLEGFRTALRSGLLPNGVQLDTIAMPTALSGHLTDLETAALFAYFRSLPPKPFGQR